MEPKWTVFIPYQLLVKSSGFLFGTISEDIKCVVISDLKETIRISDSHCLVGIWENVKNKKLLNKSSLPSLTANIALSNCTNGDLKCVFHHQTKKNAETCNCVVFNPEELKASYFLPEETCPDRSAISHLYKELNNKKDAATPTEGIWWIFWVTKFLWLFQSVSLLIDNRLTRCSDLLTRITSTPAISSYIISKSREYRKVQESGVTTGIQRVGLLNILGRQVVDSGLGLLVMYIVMQSGISSHIADFILEWADYIADELNTLLNWLMGAPAGLKLNKQLTEFLGHFFLYHIYLWKGYLTIIRPGLGSAIWYTSLLGILGLKAQLCLLQDIVSMMTLHIYCFYVYAARLYKLQIYILSALWRLFRGKKWNVLRLRVDSASYDVDQLFLGTLLFTILLFMLPTTALYYVVFTLLRLLILIFQSIPSKFVNFLSAVPAFSLILWISGHISVAGDLSFDIVHQEDADDMSVFSMQVCQMPLTKLVYKSRNPFSVRLSAGLSWGRLIHDILTGDLIYPWVELDKNQKTL